MKTFPLAEAKAQETGVTLAELRVDLDETPYRVTKPLTGYRSGYIGISFRIILAIDDDANKVHVRLVH